MRQFILERRLLVGPMIRRVIVDERIVGNLGMNRVSRACVESERK